MPHTFQSSQSLVCLPLAGHGSGFHLLHIQLSMHSADFKSVSSLSDFVSHPGSFGQSINPSPSLSSPSPHCFFVLLPPSPELLVVDDVDVLDEEVLDVVVEVLLLVEDVDDDDVAEVVVEELLVDVESLVVVEELLLVDVEVDVDVLVEVEVVVDVVVVTGGST